MWLTLRDRDQLGRTVERPEAFLSVAVRNQQRSELRRQSRNGRLSVHDPTALLAAADSHAAETGESRCDAPDELVAAEQFVEGLDEPYRSAVAYSLLGMNRREVADQMGVSHAAVRKWMQRLRERLPALA